MFRGGRKDRVNCHGIAGQTYHKLTGYCRYRDVTPQAV